MASSGPVLKARFAEVLQARVSGENLDGSPLDRVLLADTMAAGVEIAGQLVIVAD